MTADAARALILADHAGFGVSDRVLTAGLDATARLAQNEREKRPGIEWGTAVPLAALALAEGGRSVSAYKNIRFMMARWDVRPASLTCTKLAITTLAAKRAGNTVLAAELMGRLWSASQEMGGLLAWPESPHRPQQGVQQDVPDVHSTAWALLAAESVDPADPRLERAARWLMASRTGDHWICPETTSVVALGLSAWMARSQEAQADCTAEVVYNGVTAASVHFDRTSIDRPGVLIPVPGTWLRTGSNDIALRKRGRGRLYYSLEMRQSLAIPPSPPPPSLWREVLARVFRTRAPALPFTPSGYRIRRVYMRLTSRRGLFWEDSVPARESHFNSGENIVVRLIIDCTRPGSHLIVEEPIPPGCEITETPAEFLNDWDHWWDYTDVPDGRIVFFISDLSRGRSEIDYHLQARIPGSYDVLPTLITGRFRSYTPRTRPGGPYVDRSRHGTIIVILGPRSSAGKGCSAAEAAIILGTVLLVGLTVVCGQPTSPDVVLSSYATDLVGRTPNQRFNAVRSAGAVNGAVIAPRGIFAFNRRVGTWSADRGYRRAPVSYDGVLVDEYGGGVCQTSTTLYNAALLAGLPVLERHAHTFSPGYAPPGRDAAVAYANVNLIFRNPFSWPLKIEMRREGSRLVARIKGQHRGWSEVIVRSKVLDTFTPPTSPVRPGAGERRSRWHIEGRDGVRVVIERELLDPAPGNPAGRRLSRVRREFISDNSYLPIAAAEWR